MFDVAVIGGGPAGATCAALCAKGGLRTLLIERSQFPREKVCGDCVNPLAFNVFQQLGVQDRILACEHSRLRAVRFVASNGSSVRVKLPERAPFEIGLARSLLDAVLLQRAREFGAHVCEESTLIGLERIEGGWKMLSATGAFEAKQLVAADGRNSTVARLLGMMPPKSSDNRIGMQTHIPIHGGFESDVCLYFSAHGYAGTAPVGNSSVNVCLVGNASDIPQLKDWASRLLPIPPAQPWRSIAPLHRAPITPVAKRLWFVGDTAKVVEPFTGEGITYALQSGSLCAEAVLADDPMRYDRSHRALYQGRLWVNDLARWACRYPSLGSAVVMAGRHFPSLLTHLTAKIVR